VKFSIQKGSLRKHGLLREGLQIQRENNMPLEKDKFENQIQGLGDFSRYCTRKEIQFLPEILRADETVRAMTSGRFKKTSNWLMVVTDQRILCLRKGIIFGLKQVELPIGQISGIAHSTGIMFGEIVATTSGGNEILDLIIKKDVLRVAAALSELVSKNEKRRVG
jgi:hypothetical protein